jgi:hypothetical protein
MRPAAPAAFSCRQTHAGPGATVCIHAQDLDGLHVVGLLAGAHDQLGGVALERALLGLPRQQTPQHSAHLPRVSTTRKVPWIIRAAQVGASLSAGDGRRSP